MRKLLILTATSLSIFLGSCQKETENLVPPTPLETVKEEIVSISSASKPTSTTKGMKNYESYFVSKEDGKTHGYIISTPKDYSTSKKYPLLLFMHGSGEKPGNDYDLDKLKYHGPHREIFNKGRSFPAIVISFQLSRYEGEFNPKVVKELIDIVAGLRSAPKQDNDDDDDDDDNKWKKKDKENVGLQKYSVDLNRIHLTGLSLGGNGVFKTAYTYPDFFASISEFAGYTGSKNEMSRIKIPTYIRHSTGDRTVGSYNAVNAKEWINAANPNKQLVNFLLFNSNNHDSWSNEYSRTDGSSVYEWHWGIYRNGSSTPPQPPVNNNPSDNQNGLTISTLSPANNSIAPASNKSSISISFSKPIRKSHGEIEIKNLTENTSYKLNSDWGMVKVSNNTVSIYPLELKYGHKYAIRMEGGSFSDFSGKPSPAITNDNVWTFSVGKHVDSSEPENNENPELITYWPQHNAAINRPSSGYIDLNMDFNKKIKKGSGKIIIKNLTDNTVFTVYADWGMVKTQDKKAILYPIPVQSGKKYAVTIENGSFKDDNYKSYKGIDNTWTWNFSVK